MVRDVEDERADDRTLAAQCLRGLFELRGIPSVDDDLGTGIGKAAR